MSPVKLFSLITPQEEEILEHSRSLKANIIEVALKDIRLNSANMCNVPLKYELLEASNN